MIKSIFLLFLLIVFSWCGNPDDYKQTEENNENNIPKNREEQIVGLGDLVCIKTFFMGVEIFTGHCFDKEENKYYCQKIYEVE